MESTKAYVSWFDGFNGVAVDYLDNQIDFNVSQVPPAILPYLTPNTKVNIDFDTEGDIILVTLPENSIKDWEYDADNIFVLNEEDEYDEPLFEVINAIK